MTRAETTKFLGDLLIVRFKDRTYWARERIPQGIG